MNLILFEKQERRDWLAVDDSRSRVLKEQLKLGVGGIFDAGIIPDQRWRVRIKSVEKGGLCLDWFQKLTFTGPGPLELAIACNRPLVMRRILEDLTALGIAHFSILEGEKGEKSYAGSGFWKNGEYHEALRKGAAQAFSPYIPGLKWLGNLTNALPALKASGHRLIALDNYHPCCALSEDKRATEENPVTLLLGPERGWSEAERKFMASRGILFRHLGPRVLNTHTAAIAAAALMLGDWQKARWFGP